MNVLDCKTFAFNCANAANTAGSDITTKKSRKNKIKCFYMEKQCTKFYRYYIFHTDVRPKCICEYLRFLAPLLCGPNGLPMESLATRNTECQIGSCKVDNAQQTGSNQRDRFALGLAFFR